MNEYIFYTTEGHTSAPYEDVEVENCQVIGRAKGNSKIEALSTLLKENPWITEVGFVPSEFIAKQLLTTEIRDDVNIILEYLQKNKNKRYESEDKHTNISDIIKRLKWAICQVE